MKPKKLAVVGVTLIIVVAGIVAGTAFLIFPEYELSITTRDTDLLELGVKVPDTWEFEMSDDTTLSLSDLEGHVVLVDLMAIWCSSCAIQNGYLETVYDSLGDSLIIISLTVDSSETASMIANYKLEEDLAWAHGVDDGKFLYYFSISSIPSMVLIDANGYFRYFHVGLWSVESISSTVGLIQ